MLRSLIAYAPAHGRADKMAALLTLLAEEKAKSQQLSEGEAKTAGAGLKSHRDVSR